MALVCAVVTRSPFWSSHVPVCGTESIPSCAIPAMPAILAERPPAYARADAAAAGAARGPMIGIAAVDVNALRPAAIA
ncbi:hypothetical protein D3C72_2000550 [compost metagenome]